jgi:RimJ/RimL family protein N-acetyltransferase
VPPTDASAGTDTAPAADARTHSGSTENNPACDTRPGGGVNDPTPGTDSEDTLDLRLPDEFLALIANEAAGIGAERCDNEADNDADTHGAARSTSVVQPRDDLLDRVADWGPVTTPVGVFHLVPMDAERDLPLVGRWMNDPTVAEFWELAGPHNRAEEHVKAQLTGDGRSVPCLGLLDGTPMSYWELYRADLDPVARHYPARPHDTGIHLLIGSAADRGRGLGSALLRAVADLALDKRPACARVIAEPDIRNTPSIAAFLTAGFRFSAEVDLPDKRAALMVRDRSLRHLL